MLSVVHKHDSGAAPEPDRVLAHHPLALLAADDLARGARFGMDV